MKTITRSQAIDALRRELLKLVDSNSSLCLVAARRGLFCNGFARWSSQELERRFPWILHREPAPTREELERQANRWQLASQDVREDRLPCDVADHERSPACSGWNEFYESELAQCYREMCGEEVRVVPDTLEAAPVKTDSAAE